MHDIAGGDGNRRLIAEFDKTVAFKDHVAFDDVVQTVPACRHARRYACPRNRQSWIVVMVRPFADEAALLGPTVDHPGAVPASDHPVSPVHCLGASWVRTVGARP